MFGLLTFAFAYVAFFEVPAVLGTNAIVTREMSYLRGAQAGEFWRSAVALRLVLFAGSLAAAACVACVVFRDNPAGRPVVLWACLGLVTSLRAVYIARLRAHLRAGWSAWVTLGRAAVYCGLVVSVVVLGGGVIDVVLCSLAATLAALLAERRLANSFALPRARATLERVMSILRESWPLALSSVLTIIQVRIDVVMLQALDGSLSVGIYGAALKPAEAAYIVSGALTVSAFPVLAKAYRRNPGRYDGLCRELLLLMLLLGIPFATILAPLSDRLIPALFGDLYASSGRVLSILCLQVPLGYVNVLLVNLLICARKQRWELWASVLTTATNVAANAVLIPTQGAVGAAIATVLCQGVALVVLVGMVYRSSRFQVPWRHIGALVAIGACSGLAVLWLRERAHWFASGAIVGVLYLAFCFLFVYRRRWGAIKSRILLVSDDE